MTAQKPTPDLMQALQDSLGESRRPTSAIAGTLWVAPPGLDSLEVCPEGWLWLGQIERLELASVEVDGLSTKITIEVEVATPPKVEPDPPDVPERFVEIRSADGRIVRRFEIPALVEDAQRRRGLDP